MARPEAPCHTLADDANTRRFDTVLISERSSLQHRNAERIEEAAAGRFQVGGGRFTFLQCRLALDTEHSLQVFHITGGNIAGDSERPQSR